MRKLNTLLLTLFSIYNSYAISTLPTPEIFELKTECARLVIDKKNNLKIHENNGAIQIITSINHLWKIVLKNKVSGIEYPFEINENVQTSQIDNMIHICSSNYVINDIEIPLETDFTITIKDNAFCFAGSLHVSNDEWEIGELVYPIIEEVSFKNKDVGIYWPAGLGEYFDNSNVFGSKHVRYPSGGQMSMPWFSINSLTDGLYIGSHDPLQGTKIFSLEYNKDNNFYTASINATIRDVEYSIPDIMVMIYPGKWYTASKFYRNWYDKHFKLWTPPEWVKNNSGWLLAILKQQNMEIMWVYKEIDKLCDIAERLNLGTIGLFGWAVGGHDHLYPYYPPDNLMGGRRELETAIERAQKRGIRIIIYANGHIMDTSTDYYKYNGYETIVIQKDRQPQIQYYIKQKNSTPVIFAQACTGSDMWRRTMYDMGIQAASLGADGILYDQLGIMDPYLCWSDHHNHKPGLIGAESRLQLVLEARQEAQTINPEFIVMTEGLNDNILQGIDFHHGCGDGFQITQVGFPGMFRYTFPELIATQRNPNPMITRTDANYAAIYGLRHEIESRYPGDVDYLINGTLPTKETYSNVVDPPNVEKMNLEPADKATQYVHSLIEFEKENADFFRRGNFIDEEGIEVTGSDILAKGFMNGNSLGVVVWNQNLNETKKFSVSVPGYRFVKSSKPGTQNEFKPIKQLEPNSICIHVYEKNLKKGNN